MTAGPVVVGLLTHKDPPMVRRIVSRVLEGGATVALVHHDPRGPSLELEENDRVRLVRGAQPANWGGMGVAEAQFRALAAATTLYPDLSWFLLVSGQDYPCHSMRTIEAELDASRHDAFVRHFRVERSPRKDVHPWQAVTRRRYLRRRRLPGTHRAILWPRRHPFRGRTKLYVGDMWVNLGRAAVHHVLEQRQRRPDLERYFRTVSIPDEAMLTTLLFNEGEHLDIAADHRRFIRWSGQPHPKTLTMKDLPDLLSTDAFFARKFDPLVDRRVLDHLDAHARPPAS